MMQKLIKLIMSVAGSLVLLIVIAITALVVFINPNDFKTQISEKVHQATGRQLIINGNISWSFFPWLGLQVNNVTLSNAKNFGAHPFAQIKQAEIRAQLLPLLKGEISIGTLAIDGLVLNLSKNSQGVNNWQDLLVSSAKQSESNTTHTDKTKQHHFHLATLAIANIEIANSHITWNNLTKNQIYDINQLQLKSKAINFEHAFPVEMQFTLQSKQPQVSTDIYLNSKITLNPNKLDKPTILGTLRSKQLQFGKLIANDIIVQFNTKNGLIILNPITAKLYQGNYNGNIVVDTNSNTLKITTDNNLSNIQAEPLMRALAGITHVQIAGTGNLSTHLVTQGDNGTTILKNLNGNGNFSLNNGILKGINIRQWIHIAQALIHKTTPPAPSQSNQTEFGKLTGTFTITNGVFKNDDLLLQAFDLRVSGKGTANLVSQNLDYTLNAQFFSDSGKPQTPVIPLLISGNFSNINVRLNLQNLLIQTATQQLKVQVGEQLQKHLGKELGDQLNKTLDSLFH